MPRVPRGTSHVECSTGNTSVLPVPVLPEPSPPSACAASPRASTSARTKGKPATGCVRQPVLGPAGQRFFRDREARAKDAPPRSPIDGARSQLVRPTVLPDTLMTGSSRVGCSRRRSDGQEGRALRRCSRRLDSGASGRRSAGHLRIRAPGMHRAPATATSRPILDNPMNSVPRGTLLLPLPARPTPDRPQRVGPGSRSGAAPGHTL